MWRVRILLALLALSSIHRTAVHRLRQVAHFVSSVDRTNYSTLIALQQRRRRCLRCQVMPLM